MTIVNILFIFMFIRKLNKNIFTNVMRMEFTEIKTYLYVKDGFGAQKI